MEKTETFFGLGRNVVVRLLQVVKNFHEVYFDNFFTSFGLQGQLRINR